RIERVKKLLVFQRRDDRLPSESLALVAGVVVIKRDLQIDIENARIVFGALDVTGEPVERISDAGKHVEISRRSCLRSYSSSTTQVSLEPPPCEEFTTS